MAEHALVVLLQVGLVVFREEDRLLGREAVAGRQDRVALPGPVPEHLLATLEGEPLRRRPLVEQRAGEVELAPKLGQQRPLADLLAAEPEAAAVCSMMRVCPGGAG